MFKTLKFVTLALQLCSCIAASLCCCFFSPPLLVARLKCTRAKCYSQPVKLSALAVLMQRKKMELSILLSQSSSAHPHLKTSKRLRDDGADTSGESAPAVMSPPAALKLDVLPHCQCKAAFEVGWKKRNPPTTPAHFPGSGQTVSERGFGANLMRMLMLHVSVRAHFGMNHYPVITLA